MIKARLIHQVSEFNFLKMICFQFSKSYNSEERTLEQAKKSLNDLKYAIEVTKDEIQSGFYSSAAIERLVFDIFLLQVFQEFAEYLVEDPLDMMLRDMPAEIQEKIKDMPFYGYTNHILKFDLRDSAEIFDEMDLPLILKPFKELIKKSI